MTQNSSPKTYLIEPDTKSCYESLCNYSKNAVRDSLINIVEEDPAARLLVIEFKNPDIFGPTDLIQRIGVSAEIEEAPKNLPTQSPEPAISNHGRDFSMPENSETVLLTFTDAASAQTALQFIQRHPEKMQIVVAPNKPNTPESALAVHFTDAVKYGSKELEQDLRRIPEANVTLQNACYYNIYTS